MKVTIQDNALSFEHFSTVMRGYGPDGEPVVCATVESDAQATWIAVRVSQEVFDNIESYYLNDFGAVFTRRRIGNPMIAYGSYATIGEPNPVIDFSIIQSGNIPEEYLPAGNTDSDRLHTVLQTVKRVIRQLDNGVDRKQITSLLFEALRKTGGFEDDEIMRRVYKK